MIPLDKNFWKHALPSLYRDLIKGPHHSTLNPSPEEYLSYSLQIHQLIEKYREETGDHSVDQTLKRIKDLHGKRHLRVEFDAGIIRENGKNKYVAHGFAILEGDKVLVKHVFRGSLYIDEFANPAPSGDSMTTHIAEYIAMFAALECLCDLVDDCSQIDLDIYTDSANVYKHLMNLSRSRNPMTLHLRNRGIFLLSRFGSYRLYNIPREENRLVDGLVKQEFKRMREEDELKG